MTPHKTERALAALQSHRSPLTLLQRRALILADGQRDVAALAALLGSEGATLVQTLCAMGYLESAADTAADALHRATPLAAVAAAQPQPMPATEEDVQRLRRRALANARLYLLDILQLQRNPVAVALHGQLQAARAADEIAATIDVALRDLPQFTSSSYAERVRMRIGELLPETLQAA